MNLQETIDEMRRFRKYVMESFTGYLREDDDIDTQILLDMLEEYNNSECPEVQNARTDLSKRITALKSPGMYEIVDAMSEVIPDLDEKTDDKVHDAQLLEYCDKARGIYRDVQDKISGDWDVTSLCEEINSLGARYNDVTDRYSQTLSRVIQEVGADKKSVLTLMEDAINVVYEDVVRRNGLDEQRQVHPERQHTNRFDKRAFQDYREEINNIGMYVLNMEVGHQELPRIIQKVRERGDAYNTYTQRISHRIVQRLAQVQDNESYSDDEVQVAAMGILMGSAEGMKHMDDDEG